jgi:peptidoglycan/LPS O-acetylase OafA/YrhL
MENDTTSAEELVPACEADVGAVPRLAYRPALDGIRAIAVGAVVAYHLGIEKMPGGFLGVDVFFVLSGYLITTLLVLERDATGAVALGRFWMRRARRLLPALLLLLVVVTIWIHQTAPDFELAQRRLDLQWALFYGSNWHLIASAQDYFAQGAGVSIVRHTWSLAIEEQFYLLWPLVVGSAMWIARGRVKNLVAICVVGVVGSAVAMALLHDGADQSRSYYGTDTRMHQLLIGALLAIIMLRVPAMRAPRRIGTAIAVGALALLAAAFVGLDDGSSRYYRGGSVTVAVAAAALIWGLEVAREGGAARALGVAPMRGIGRISYGVYLWHWPVIAAIGAPAAVFEWLPGTIGLNVTRVTITLAIAATSFVLVERPVLQGRAPALVRAWPRLVRATAGGIATLAVFAVVAATIAVLTTGSSLQAEAATTGGATQLDRLDCTFVICVRHEAQGPDAPVVAVVGDSIARSLDLGFVEQARRGGWTYLTASAGGCRVSHLLTSSEGNEAEYRRCFETTPGLFQRLKDRWAPDVVVIVENMELADIQDGHGAIVHAGSTEWAIAERRELGRVVGGFTSEGAYVVLVETAPNVTPKTCLRDDHFDQPECVVAASADELAAAFNRIEADVAARFPGQASVVSMTPYLCPGGLCAPTAEGVFARYDGHHFSRAGSRWIVPRLIADMRLAGAFPAGE